MTEPAYPAAHPQPTVAVEVASHSDTGNVADSLVVIVAPSTGRFRPVSGTSELEAGDLVGHVTGGGGRADEVRSPVRAVLQDLLVRPGQLVMQGQGLAWLGRA